MREVWYYAIIPAQWNSDFPSFKITVKEYFHISSYTLLKNSLSAKEWYQNWSPVMYLSDIRINQKSVVFTLNSWIAWILVKLEVRNTALKKPFLCYCKNLDCNFEFILRMWFFFSIWTLMSFITWRFNHFALFSNTRDQAGGNIQNLRRLP